MLSSPRLPAYGLGEVEMIGTLGNTFYFTGLLHSYDRFCLKVGPIYLQPVILRKKALPAL